MSARSAAVVLAALVAAACDDREQLADGDGSGPGGQGSGAAGPAQAVGSSGAETVAAATGVTSSASSAATGGGGPGRDPGPEDPAVPAPGTWIAVSPGSFSMGAPAGDDCYDSDNQVLHSVTLTHPFELSATEVTFADFAEATGAAHPSFAGCADCPVPLMSWHQAAATCNAYSAYAGLVACYACTGTGSGTTCQEVFDPHTCNGYRLPTEAEWEYAYRAGTTTPVYWGVIDNCGGFDPNLDAIAWYLYNAGGAAHPVAGKAPNPWGFYDLSGNLWEWTHDGYISDLSTLPATDPVAPSPDGLRVMRGGSYNCVPEEIRAAHRSALPDEVAGLNVGVRCARTLD